MSKVYLVSTGCYSNYSVNGVFSSRERAESYIATCSGGKDKDFNEIDEYELDDGIPEIERGLKLFGVKITRNGDVLEVKPGGYPSIVSDEVRWAEYEWDFKSNPYRRIDLPRPAQHVTMWVWATDQEHAVKVANERRIMALAAETRS